MKKLIYDYDNNDDFLLKSGNLVNLIESNKHIKSASSSVISREMLENCKPDKDHFLVHLIAMGDFEHYGPNRNADAFSKEACENFHDTFVKKGAFYREHNTGSDDLKIGQIKASAYDPAMGRIELAIWGHKKKASDAYEKVKSGEPLSFSMSCSVKKDVCNACGHEAHTPGEHCEHIKYASNRYIPEFKKYAFMWNPEPQFYDISMVKKPADRIAHYLYYGMDKAASHGKDLNLSYDYTRVQNIFIPDDMCLGCQNPEKQKILQKLAAAESYVNDVINGKDIPNDERYNFVKHAALKAFDPNTQLTESQINKLAELIPQTLYRGLAKRSTFLPFKSFASYVTGISVNELDNKDFFKWAMIKELPFIFNNMLKSPFSDLEDEFDIGSKTLEEFDSNNTDEVQDIMDEASDKFGLSPDKVKPRCIQISITTTKHASLNNNYNLNNISENDKNFAKRLASAYGMYKISGIQYINSNFNIDEQHNYLLISQNNI